VRRTAWDPPFGCPAYTSISSSPSDSQRPKKYLLALARVRATEEQRRGPPVLLPLPCRQINHEGDDNTTGAMKRGRRMKDRKHASILGPAPQSTRTSRGGTPWPEARAELEIRLSCYPCTAPTGRGAPPEGRDPVLAVALTWWVGMQRRRSGLRRLR
jgi:hypothetical protein